MYGPQTSSSRGVGVDKHKRTIDDSMHVADFTGTGNMFHHPKLVSYGEAVDKHVLVRWRRKGKLSKEILEAITTANYEQVGVDCCHVCSLLISLFSAKMPTMLRKACVTIASTSYSQFV